MQGLFRNPLADPGIIGVSGGAALGAALAIVLLAPLAPQYGQQLQTTIGVGLLPLLAFLGGALTTTLVLSARHQRGGHLGHRHAAGWLVAITALSGAVIGLLTYLADDQMLRNLSLWQMGTLAAGKPADVALALLTLAALLWLFMRDANPLNALLLGEGEARHLGVNVQSLKRRLILLTAAGVGVAVAVSGMIGFVGLVVPHLVRLLAGPNHVRLLPLSALLGAALLLAADMLARTLLAPAELPVGIITALIGAPFFIWLLVTGRRAL